MKKIMAIMLFMGIVTGCATKSEIVTLQVQVDYLKDRTTQAATTAKEALVEANNANTNTSLAQAAAENAEVAIKNVNERIDKLAAE